MDMTPPPRLPLSLFPQLVLIQNLVFKERNVVLDGYQFRNCAFVNSTLVVHRGNFSLEECFFQGDWWVYFDGNAQRVVKLNSILNPNAAPPGLKAEIHPNGGVTIK